MNNQEEKKDVDSKNNDSIKQKLTFISILLVVVCVLIVCNMVYTYYTNNHSENTSKNTTTNSTVTKSDSNNTNSNGNKTEDNSSNDEDDNYDELAKNLSFTGIININGLMIVKADNNNSEDMDYCFEIVVTFYDENDNVISTLGSIINTIKANSSRYCLITDELPSNYAKYDFQIQKYSLSNNDFIMIKELDYEVQENDTISIILTNTYDTRICASYFTIVYYDENHNILDVEPTGSSYVNSGETYSIDTYGPYKDTEKAAYSSYEVLFNYALRESK